eukprot:11224739-Lingulodinium_polyedra.AAC.1
MSTNQNQPIRTNQSESTNHSDQSQSFRGNQTDSTNHSESVSQSVRVIQSIRISLTGPIKQSQSVRAN